MVARVGGCAGVTVHWESAMLLDIENQVNRRLEVNSLKIFSLDPLGSAQRHGQRFLFIQSVCLRSLMDSPNNAVRKFASSALSFSRAQTMPRRANFISGARSIESNMPTFW